MFQHLFDRFAQLFTGMSDLDWLCFSLLLLAYVPYVCAVVWDPDAEPSIISWFIWASLDVLTMFGQDKSANLNIQIVGAAFGGCMMFLLSLRYGQMQWDKKWWWVNVLCLLGGTIALVFLLIYKDPEVSVIISLLASICGLIPTGISAWKEPKHENRWGWLIFLFSCIAAMFAIQEWTFFRVLQQTTFLLDAVVMVTILFVRPFCLWCRKPRIPQPPDLVSVFDD